MEKTLLLQQKKAVLTESIGPFGELHTYSISTAHNWIDIFNHCDVYRYLSFCSLIVNKEWECSETISGNYKVHF